jgi:membrane associated rhomboid family serine protease
MFVVTGFGRLASSELAATLWQSNSAVADGEWWRIFTPVLLHGSITHILFNMWALWVLGPQIERSVGSRAFVGLYLAAAGIGGAAFFYMSDAGGLAVGASGAIFGLFGVWLSWAIQRRNTMWGRAMLSQLGFLLLINAALPLFIRGIAWEAHLGGLAAGFALGWLWGLMDGPNAERMRTLVAFAVAALAAVLAII